MERNLPIELGDASSTGAVYFDGLALNADPTKYDHGEMKGYVVDNVTDPDNPTVTEVIVPAETGVDFPPEYLGGAITILAYDKDGNPFYKNGLNLTNEEARQYIMVGFLIHLDMVNLDEVINSTTTILSPASQMGDLLKAVQPISNGLKYSPNGANLKINRSAGDLVGLGYGTLSATTDSFKNPNQLILPEEIEVSNMLYAQATGETADIVGNNIDPTTWENPLGTLATVSNNKFTIQYIVSFVQGRTNIQWGQTEYSSLEDAKQAIESEIYVKNGAIDAFATVLCALVVQKECTDLSDPTRAFFKNFGKFGGNI